MQIVLYSWTGNTAACAVALQEVTGVEPFLLIEEEEREGSKGFALGGYQASIGKKTKVKALPTLTDDTLVLGMPVWAGTTPPAINTFLDSADLSGKKIYAFATEMGDSVPKKLEKRLRKVAEKKGATFVHLFVLQVRRGTQLSVEAAKKSAERWVERISTGA